MTYTVYMTPEGEVGTTTGVLPGASSLVWSADNPDEASKMVTDVTLGLLGQGEELLCCKRCWMPAWPDGRGGWMHREAADDAFCALTYGAPL